MTTSIIRWDYLTEKLAYERRVRETKLKAAMTQAKKRNAEFVELVEKNKTEKFVAGRKRDRSSLVETGEGSGLSNSGGTGGGDTEEGDNRFKRPKIKRSFKQQQPIGERHGEKASKVDSAVLKSVFGSKS